MTDLMATEEAARLIGVTSSSLKRWADRGEVPCLRTPGGHRRFARETVERFLRTRSSAPAAVEPHVEGWLEGLIEARPLEIEGALLGARARLGSWHAVADEVGAALAPLGWRWEAGELGIADEHAAADALARALARIAESLPGRPDGPRCLLACAEGDDHTLGLSLAEVCLREVGWSALWLGRRTPTLEIARVVGDGRVRLVALSASVASSDAAALTAMAARVGAACRERGAALVVGGGGAWPERPPHATRLRSFAELHAHLRSPGS